MIRDATLKDADGIANVHVDTWRSAYRGIMPQDYLDTITVEQRVERWQQLLTDASFHTRVAEHEATVVGWVTYGECRGDDAQPQGCYEIYALYVLPEFWGQGVGCRLMRDAEQALVAWGASCLVLWVLERNERARRFYAKLGYAPNGTHDRQSIGGEEFVKLRYSKPVSDSIEQQAPLRNS